MEFRRNEVLDMKQKKNIKMKKMASVPIYFNSDIKDEKVQNSFKDNFKNLNDYLEDNVLGRKIFELSFRLGIKIDVVPKLIIKDIDIKKENGYYTYKFLLNINEFFKNYPDKNISFGKSLIYDPRDIFEPNAQKLIDIFVEMEKYGLEHLFTKREVEIPGFLVEKIVPLIPKLCVNEFFGDPVPQIFINKVKNGYIIDISNLKNWHILNNSIMIYENENFFKFRTFDHNSLLGIKFLKNFIYQNSDEEKEKNKQKNIIEIFNDEIDIKKFIDKYKEFINIIYPKDVKENFYSPEKIEPALIFDMERGILTAFTEVLYDGKRKVNIKEKISTDPFIIKKVLREAEEILLDNKFVNYKEDGKFCLLGEERVYHFLTEKLKTLTSQCAIFYTGRLKNKKFISTKASITFNTKIDTNIFFKIDDLTSEESAEILLKIKDEKPKNYFKLKNGSIIRLENKDLENFKKNLMGIGATEEELLAGKIKRKHYYDFFLNNYNSSDIEGDNYAEYFSKLDFVPRDYQKTGINWLLNLKEKRMGGILADDMGLGKTIQALSFLYISSLLGNNKPNLIVVPKSILYNWANEIKKYFKNINYTIVLGLASERKLIIKDIAPNELVITSYSLINRDIELYKNIEFGTMILDEAQSIKNNTSLTFKAIKKLKRDTCFALTGTPIENHLNELWSIFDTVLPGYFGSITSFKDRYLKNDEYSVLKALIKPFIMRRMKKDVLKELPEKIEKDIFIELEPFQKRIYSSFINNNKAQIKNSDKIEPFTMLKFLSQLRQICTYPRNIIENYTETSGKEKVLFELLDNLIENGHKVIVFSQYTSGLKTFKEKLSRLYKVFYLTGDISEKKRVELVDKFNNLEADIFLISLKAGGIGLNITGADVVIHYDPWWNPAIEAQATDRAYRIGQKKTVLVYNLITKETIEEYIYNLKKAKQHLSDNVLNNKNAVNLSKEDIIKFFKS